LSAILIADMVVEEVVGMSLSIPESLFVTGSRLDGDGRILINFTSHGERSRSGAESSKCEAVKDWKAREQK
jgi:hypothetical protein